MEWNLSSVGKRSECNLKRKRSVVILGFLTLLLLTGVFWAKKDDQESLDETIRTLELVTVAGSASRGSSGILSRDGLMSTGFSKSISSTISKEEYEKEIRRRLGRLGWVQTEKPVGVHEICMLSGKTSLWQRGKQLIRFQLTFAPKEGRLAYFWIQRNTTVVENLKLAYQAWRLGSGRPTASYEISTSTAP